jgi:hypothetical protein
MIMSLPLFGNWTAPEEGIQRHIAFAIQKDFQFFGTPVIQAKTRLELEKHILENGDTNFCYLLVDLEEGKAEIYSLEKTLAPTRKTWEEKTPRGTDFAHPL